MGKDAPYPLDQDGDPIPRDRRSIRALLLPSIYNAGLADNWTSETDLLVERACDAWEQSGKNAAKQVIRDASKR